MKPGSNKTWLQNQHGGNGCQGRQDQCGSKNQTKTWRKGRTTKTIVVKLPLINLQNQFLLLH